MLNGQEHTNSYVFSEKKKGSFCSKKKILF